jgi:hypothetical protein
VALIIVPLAGPDAYDEAGCPRALEETDRGPALGSVLGRRPWTPSQSGSDEAVFVIRDHPTGAAKLETYIRQIFPGARVVRLGAPTRGALLTVVAGLGALRDPDAAVVVDLADIAFTWRVDIEGVFASQPRVDAIVPWFESQAPCYSYLTLVGDRVAEAREKRVISSHATAGAYVFRNVPVLLRAIAHGLAHPDETLVGSSYFVCPILNGVIASGSEVLAAPVTEVVSHSARRHPVKGIVA